MKERLSPGGQVITLAPGVLLWSGKGEPRDGKGGTGLGRAGTGSKYINIETGVEYINRGSAEEPVWCAQGISAEAQAKADTALADKR
jgi:hypothetical protein